MDLKKIIEKCENKDEFKVANIDELLNKYSMIIKARDNFLSGWGAAEGVNAYSLVLCESREQALKIMRRMRADNFSYVNVKWISGFKAIDNHNIYTLRLGNKCYAWNK